MPEDCVFFCYIDFDDEEFKRIMENARRKLEIPMPAAMPCRIQLSQHRETGGNVGQHKLDAKVAVGEECKKNLRRYQHGS